MRPNDALLTWDVKDAYHHLVLHPQDRNLQPFSCLRRG